MFSSIFNSNPGNRVSCNDMFKLYFSSNSILDSLLASRSSMRVNKPQSVESVESYQSKYSHSRYYNDFEEIEFLGKGGFGEVVKVIITNNLINSIGKK